MDRDPQTHESPRGSYSQREVLGNVTRLGLLAALFGLALHYLGPILQPFLIALFLFFLIKPAADWMTQRGVPRLLAYALVFPIVLIGFLGAGLIVYENVEGFQERFPHYRDRFWSWVVRTAETFGAEDPNKIWDQNVVQDVFALSPTALAQFLFGTVIGFLGNFLAIVFYLIFIVLEEPRLPRRIDAAFPTDVAARWNRLGTKITESVKTYLFLKTVISLGTGACAALLMWLFELDFWPLWAVLAFLFNYIPYVGSIIASIPPMLIAFIQFDSLGAAIVLSALVLINQLFWGNFLDPKIMGWRLNISPLALLLILAYLGWLWGIPGMILSVPFAVVIKAVLASSKSLSPVATLLSDVPDPKG